MLSGPLPTHLTEIKPPTGCRLYAGKMDRPRVLLTGLALAALVAGVVALFYHRAMASARQAAGEGSIVTSTPAGEIEYSERGSGTSLLSIHGSGGGFDQGLAIAEGLVGAGFRIVAPSRFGYLRTPVPSDPSAASQADAHAALLSKLGITKAIVLGTSAGARSAVDLAIRHPEMVSALILIVPALHAPDDPVSIKAGRGNEVAFRLVNTGGDFLWWAGSRVAPSVFVRFLGVPPDLLASATPAEQGRVAAIVAGVEPLSERVRGIRLDSIPDRGERPLETVAVPTLVVATRDDLFNTLPAAQFTAARIPGAKLVVFPTGGHLLVGRQEEARTVMRNFLAEASLLPR